MKKIVLLVSACILFTLPAFAQYKASQAGQGFQVVEGTIQSVREVQLEGEAGAGGTVAGGALGYAVGQSIGGGSGNTAAKIGGTVAGAGIGRRVQKNVRTEKGLEIVVKLDNGQTMGVVQTAGSTFRNGDRVRIMQGKNGSNRVERVG